MKTQVWWIIPFGAFLCGYVLVSHLTSVADVQTPAIVGMPLQDALKIISSFQLHGQIMAEREDTDLPAGTVVEQTPRPGQHSKPSQAVFLVVTKRPAAALVSAYVGHQRDELDDQDPEGAVKIKIHELESNFPLGYCFAQYPEAGTELPANKTVHLYVGAGTTSIRLLPDFRNQNVTEVVEFLEQYGVKAQLVHRQSIDRDHQCQDCMVTEQRPLPGTLVDLKKPLMVQLQVG